MRGRKGEGLTSAWPVDAYILCQRTALSHSARIPSVAVAGLHCQLPVPSLLLLLRCCCVAVAVAVAVTVALPVAQTTLQQQLPVAPMSQSPAPLSPAPAANSRSSRRGRSTARAGSAHHGLRSQERPGRPPTAIPSSPPPSPTRPAPATTCRHHAIVPPLQPQRTVAERGNALRQARDVFATPLRPCKC